eukprot:scaffold3287_cov181-Amphora_coffeaeformis.AAC.13
MGTTTQSTEPRWGGSNPSFEELVREPLPSICTNSSRARWRCGAFTSVVKYTQMGGSCPRLAFPKTTTH